MSRPAAGRREPHPDDGRAQDVPGVDQRDVDALGHLVLRAVRDVAEHRQRGAGVVLRVQRVVQAQLHDRAGGAQQLLRVRAAGTRGSLRGQVDGLLEQLLVAGVALRRALRVAPLTPGRTLGELLLEPRRVQQHEPGELRARGGAPDPAPEPLADQQRQQSAVVQVRVGEHHGVERRRGPRPAARGCASTRPARPGTCRSPRAPWRVPCPRDGGSRSRSGRRRGR